MPQKPKKILSLEEAAEKLVAVAQTHLSTMPQEEQGSRVASFGRVKFASSRGTRAKSSSNFGPWKTTAVANKPETIPH